MGKAMRFEPVLITTFVAALVSLLISFGAPISADQSDAIMKFVAAALPLLPFVVGAIIARATVWCPNSVEELREVLTS